MQMVNAKMKTTLGFTLRNFVGMLNCESACAPGYSESVCEQAATGYEDIADLQIKRLRILSPNKLDLPTTLLA
jgi:hypothetical protein